MNKHHCEGTLPSEAYGEAITHCIEDDNGKLWAGNDDDKLRALILKTYKWQLKIIEEKKPDAQ